MLSKQNIPEKKEKIIEYLNKKGPSLPSSISNSIDLSLLFTSALLSEMHREGSITMSHLKIGGSPLYLLSGQEASLDNFTNYLEKKEQEALDHLKKEGILEDVKIEPSHRVALRNIQDFAVMTTVITGDEEKTFWRLHTATKEDFEKKLREILGKKKIKPEIKKEVKKEMKKEEKEQEEEIKKEIIKEIKETKEKKEIRPKRRKKKEEVEQKIGNYLESNNLSLVKEIKQDDIFGIVASRTQLGNLNFLVVVKNKKKINDADIILVLHSGQKNKMPVLLLTPGSLTKKAQKYVEENKGYILIKNVNL